MKRRLAGAFVGDPEVYDEIQHDSAATVQAFVVVLVAALCSWAGQVLSDGLGVSLAEVETRRLYVVVPWSLFNWVVGALVLVALATFFFRVQISFVEMLRITGFVSVSLFPTIIPVIGEFMSLWTLWILYRVLQMRLGLGGGQAFLLMLGVFVCRVALSLVLSQIL